MTRHATLMMIGMSRSQFHIFKRVWDLMAVVSSSWCHCMIMMVAVAVAAVAVNVYFVCALLHRARGGERRRL